MKESLDQPYPLSISFSCIQIRRLKQGLTTPSSITLNTPPYTLLAFNTIRKEATGFFFIPDQELNERAKWGLDMTRVDSPWGRKTQATWWTALGSLFLVVICPLWIISNWIALEHYGGSLYDTMLAMWSDGLYVFLKQRAPRPTTKASLGYVAWILLQAAFYSVLPGPLSTGQLTPAGNLLQYRTNGLLAWFVTHVLVVLAGLFGTLGLAILANNWEGLLVAVNVYGVLISLFCQIKAHVAPSHPGDRKFSGNKSQVTFIEAKDSSETGSLIFDFFVGIELNPRLGQLWDLKLFHNGRPGIIAWTLMWVFRILICDTSESLLNFENDMGPLEVLCLPSTAPEISRTRYPNIRPKASSQTRY